MCTDKQPSAKTDPSPASNGHVPVLMTQVLSVINPQPGQICLDCTMGRAGHATEIAKYLGPTGRYIGIDTDLQNILAAKRRLANADCQTDFYHGNFAQTPQILTQFGLTHVDLILADLGFSSNQMADPQRGFSFMTEGPLDMRLDQSTGQTARDLVNTLPEQELADTIYEFGQERHSRKIAQYIVEQRQHSPIETTTDLADLIRKAYRARLRGRKKSTGKSRGKSGYRSRIDPSTRTFMALRIAVNHELASLKSLLEAIPVVLAPNGTAAIISFHSLEDRMVKKSFAHLYREGFAEQLTKKPATASASERRANPRSRSAKLRAIRIVEESPRSTIDS